MDTYQRLLVTRQLQIPELNAHVNLITRHTKVFFETIYLSNVEPDVPTSKCRFVTFVMGGYVLINFSKTIFISVRPTQKVSKYGQDKENTR